MSAPRVVVRLVLLAALWSASAGPVWAHGERTQEPFLRMRSILFYDCQWSKDRLKVNEDMVLSGRFRVFDDWPTDVLGRPDTAYVNTGVPGPVFVRKESFLNGINMANATSLTIGTKLEVGASNRKNHAPRKPRRGRYRNAHSVPASNRPMSTRAGRLAFIGQSS